MTMDNGEGRPLDEEEAGQDDPQGWYFDLPGGAWERQEEKNRNLRQRVLGNFEEDAEKSKGDPFGKKFELKPSQEPTFELRRPEPEAKKRGGLLRFGKKNKDEQPSPAHDGAEPSPADALLDEDDEWSTEPPLTLSPFPRTASSQPVAPWGESDGGWDLSPRAEPEAAAPSEDAEATAAEDDFAAGLRAWAQTQEREEAAAAEAASPERPSPAFNHDAYHVVAAEETPSWATRPVETVEETPSWATAPSDAVEQTPSWANAPVEAVEEALSWDLSPAFDDQRQEAVPSWLKAPVEAVDESDVTEGNRTASWKRRRKRSLRYRKRSLMSRVSGPPPRPKVTARRRCGCARALIARRIRSWTGISGRRPGATAPRKKSPRKTRPRR
jgi:hypothetical protein